MLRRCLVWRTWSVDLRGIRKVFNKKILKTGDSIYVYSFCVATIFPFFVLSNTYIYACTLTYDTHVNNIHTKISAIWLVESISIYPKCSAEMWNWVQKVEISAKKVKLNWLTGTQICKSVVSKQNGWQVWREWQHFNWKFKGKFKATQ